MSLLLLRMCEYLVSLHFCITAIYMAPWLLLDDCLFPLFYGNQNYFAIATCSVVFIYLHLYLYIYLYIYVLAMYEGVSGERKNKKKSS